MNLNKITATAAMAGGLGAAALGIGAGLAQAAPDVPGVPNIPGVPGPNVPGDRNLPGQNGPDLNQNGWNPGENGPWQNCRGQGANAFCPGSPLPPGQERNGIPFPPPGHFNDPVRYGLPAEVVNPPGFPEGHYPVFFNPDFEGGQWGFNTSTGFQVVTPVGGTNAGGNLGGTVGTPGT